MLGAKLQMQRSRVIVAMLAAGAIIALITSIAGFATLAESQSNSNRQHEEEVKSLMKEMREMKSTMSTMMEKMDMIIERMDMILGIMTGDMMPGDMGNGMEDMMSQEPLDVVIKMKLPGQKVQVGKEAEIVLLVLDKEAEEPLEGVQVLIGIERGSSMSTMDMMGDMFEAEDKGSGEYIVRFTPDIEGIYTIHTMVMLPGRTMMDNHMDFGIIAEISNV